MFANKITMAIHIKSKHLQVNYQCNVCDFITNSKDNLSQHVQAIHEGRTFQCPSIDCNKIFKRGTSILQHMRSEHLKVRYHKNKPKWLTVTLLS